MTSQVEAIENELPSWCLLQVICWLTQLIYETMKCQLVLGIKNQTKNNLDSTIPLFSTLWKLCFKMWTATRLESTLSISLMILKLGSREGEKGNLEMHYILWIKLQLIGINLILCIKLGLLLKLLLPQNSITRVLFVWGCIPMIDTIPKLELYYPE